MVIILQNTVSVKNWFIFTFINSKQRTQINKNIICREGWGLKHLLLFAGFWVFVHRFNKDLRGRIRHERSVGQNTWAPANTAAAVMTQLIGGGILHICIYLRGERKWAPLRLTALVGSMRGLSIAMVMQLRKIMTSTMWSNNLWVMIWLQSTRNLTKNK